MDGSYVCIVRCVHTTHREVTQVLGCGAKDVNQISSLGCFLQQVAVQTGARTDDQDD